MAGHRKLCTIHRVAVVGRCPECASRREADQKIRERNRGSAASRLYGHGWRKASEAFLKLRVNRNCRRCLEKHPPKTRSSTVVDHIIPHRGDLKLFWDRSNWQGLCKRCHDKKTATEDGGFGRQSIHPQTQPE